MDSIYKESGKCGRKRVLVLVETGNRKYWSWMSQIITCFMSGKGVSDED